MTQVLADGTVIPSNLTTQGPSSSGSKLYEDFSLKQGMVTAIYYPDDENNISKKHIEYDVAAVDSDMSNGTTFITYKNCSVNDPFGAGNNYEEYTLQPAEKKEKSLNKFGSRVLILCVDGRSTGGKATIIGGVGNENRPKRSKKDGQFYDFQFNGINVNINKDGEYKLTFNTPIDSKGKKKDEKAAGTSIHITKDGGISISDNESQILKFDRANKNITLNNGAESIIVDKKNKKISIKSSGDISEEAAGKMNLKSGKDLSVDSGAKVNVKSGSDISIESGSNVKAKSGSNWQIDAGGNVQVKAGGNVMLEGGMLAQLKAQMVMLGDGSSPVSHVGSMCVGIGNMGSPVMSNIITGSATVLVGT